MSGDRVLRRCARITRRGEPCRGRPMKDGDYCVAHRGQTPPPTPPHSGEGLAEVGTGRSMVVFPAQPMKELQTIEDVIEDMLQRQSQLTSLIEEKTLTEPLNVSEMTKLLTLHGQNGSRIGRLLRDQRALSGASADGLLEAIARALDELSTELGVEL
jgi:hypothetical protein